MIHAVRTLGRLAVVLLLASAPFAAAGAEPDPANWNAVLKAARGQTVYWNAWGGDSRINDYVGWVGRKVKSRHGIKLVHVKLSDTATAVSRVVAEKSAGTVSGGAVDLIWINGENFASMQRNGLLFGPWAEQLPNFPLTDPDNNPAVRNDFTVPVLGLEAPWSKAQIVFYHDMAELAVPPRSIGALLVWARDNPGRFTYPLPPNFLGSTFLKQALLALATDRRALYSLADAANVDAITAPLWVYLDALHPLLWRQGRAFPAGGTDLLRLIADREIDIAFSFDPAEASSAIASSELPPSVRTYVLDGGTIGNVSFVAIPFNAAHKAGAMVLANFLLSPEAQARKQDPNVWGSSTVLSMNQLAPGQRKAFDDLDLGVATLSPAELGAPVPELHPSWMERLEVEWAKRYTAR
jgi:putative thiamine transport system substrate-binding protein